MALLFASVIFFVYLLICQIGITNINRMNELVQIQQQIYLVNGERVMFDDDLAKLYGVETA